MAQWSVGLRSERLEVRNLPPPCCVLKQDILLPESTGIKYPGSGGSVPTRHNGKIVDWDVKPQHKQTLALIQTNTIFVIIEVNDK